MKYLSILLVGALVCLGGCDGDDGGVASDAGPGGGGGVASDWVSLPGGSFQMGSNDGYDNEQPVHNVQVPSFYLGRTEVTVA